MLFKTLWRAYHSIKYNDKFIESNHHYFLYWRQVEREYNSQQAYIMLSYHDWQYRYALLVICGVSQLRWWIINHVSSNGPDGPLHPDALPLFLLRQEPLDDILFNRHSSWTIISLILLPFFPLLIPHLFQPFFVFSLLFLSTLPKTAELAEESKLKSVKFNSQAQTAKLGSN